MSGTCMHAKAHTSASTLTFRCASLTMFHRLAYATTHLYAYKLREQLLPLVFLLQVESHFMHISHPQVFLLINIGGVFLPLVSIWFY